MTREDKILKDINLYVKLFKRKTGKKKEKQNSREKGQY